MQEKKKKSFSTKENKFKSVEAERFIKEIEPLIDRDRGVSWTKIAVSVGFSSQDFTDLKSAKKDLQRDFLEAVAKKYKIDKNFVWTGERILQNAEKSPLIPYTLNSDETSNNNVAEPEQQYNNEIISPGGKIVSLHHNRRKSEALIPFYNADFMAGASDSFYEDATIYPEYFMDVPEFYGCTAFRAYSDSMEKKIKSGNILFGIKVEDWRSHLEFGGIYGITMADGRRYLKYIRSHAEDNKLFLLRSENKNYDDFTIPKSKIKNIWQIEGWLDKRT